MKKYLICDAEVSTIDGIDVPVEMWIEHAEVEDSGSLEEELTTVNALRNPGVILSGEPVGMTTGVSIYKIAKFPDGTVRELERLDTEIIAMYSLYKHLESIDRDNEDNLPW